VALALPDAPDELTTRGISRTPFGERTRRPGLMGPAEGIGGFGEIGMGGDGARCHPRRPGTPWRPGPFRNPRNPITDPPGIHELPPGYRY
jgi:hypothetical protein